MAFHGQYFENVEHGVMYSHIVADNIIICHTNTHQVSKHVCVLQHAFSGEYYQL